MHKVDELKNIYEYSRYWLRFAETKNAAIIVVNSAILFGVVKYYEQMSNVFYDLSLNIAIASVILSIIIALFSQLPILSVVVKNSEIYSPNLYYFKDLANIDYDTFKFQIKKDVFYEPLTRLDEDLMQQILALSRIAVNKLKAFNIACYITLIGLIELLVFFVLIKILK